MLFTILLSSFVIVSANPFHKYPFVFLLDIGNEELETVNTKQIRVSAPGGSVALRYPAIGDGETIAHLRVSGIDFGTDLKANIVDGGPGYKYVVLVFLGNEGVSYDAVVTIQTVPTIDKADYNPVSDNINENTLANQRLVSNEVDIDENNSSEDQRDSESPTQNINRNSELSQSSSNVYYVQEPSIYDDVSNNYNNQDIDEVLSDANNEQNNDSQDDQESDENNHHEMNDDDDEGFSNYNEQDSEENHQEFTGSIAEKLGEDQDEISDAKDAIEILNNDDTINAPKADKYSVDPEDQINEEPIRLIDQNLNDKYQVLQSHFSNNFNVYPQESINQYTRPIDSPDSIDFEDPSELEQTFNDEEVHENKYRDDTKNYRDNDYGSIDYRK